MSDVIPTANGNTPAVAKRKRLSLRKTPGKLSNAQAAALDEPISKLTAAQCLLGMASVLFRRDGIDRATRAFCKRFGFPELPLREGTLDVLRYCDRSAPAPALGTEKKSARRYNAHAFGLFKSYAMKELSKRHDLHIVRQFATEGPDGHGRISMSAAATMWKSLDSKDKEHMTKSLKPFLDDLNSRVAAAASGAGPSSGPGAHVELDMLASYLQYEKAHPQLSILRLLRLEEVKELVGGGAAAAAEAEAMDIDNEATSDEGEESEAEEEEEEEGKEVKSSSEAEDEGSEQEVEEEERPVTRSSSSDSGSDSGSGSGSGSDSGSGSGSESSSPSPSPSSSSSSSPSTSSNSKEDSDGSSGSRSGEEEEEEKGKEKPPKKKAKN